MSEFSERLSRALREAVAGAGGIIFSAYIVFPIDFVKTRLQLPNSPYTSMSDGFKRIIAEEGFLTLYQGVESELLKGSLQNFLYLFSYDLMKQYALNEASFTIPPSIPLKTSHSRPLLNRTLHCYCHGSNTSGVRYAFRKEKGGRSRVRSRQGSVSGANPNAKEAQAAHLLNGHAASAHTHGDGTLIECVDDPLHDYEDEIMLDDRETRQIVKVQTATTSSKSTLDNEASSSSSSKRQPQLSIIGNLLIGIAAGCFCQFFVNPLSVIQTRIMTSKKSVISGSAAIETSIVATALAIFREEGIRAFFTGLLPAFILTTNPAIQYLVFDRLKSMLQGILSQHMNDRPISAVESFVIGAISKVTATLATYPYIMAKLRLQYKGVDGQEVKRYSGTLHVILSILKQDGIMGLYAGLRAQLLKSVLGAALMFMVKEKILALMAARSLKAETASNEIK